MVNEQMVKGEKLQQLSLDPIVLELNSLHNQLKEKEREFEFIQGEIKALRATYVLKDKAIEELRNEVSKLDHKLVLTQNVLDHKNLEINKLTNEKKEAVIAQYGAEATLRRVHATKKGDDNVSIESIIAPFEADIKMYKNEIITLQEDKKAMERLTKSKESALLEAERILKSALERALIVEDVQNENFELRKQIKIYQEENKILEKTNRKKVLEVEGLSQTIQELEEAILAGGAAANIIGDYHSRIYELQEEKRTLERELARAKVLANRVATVVANKWKDDNDKVMPVKQWLDERRVFQAEMRRLREKLAIMERTAKADAQSKEKMKLRLRTIEDGLKKSSNSSSLYGSPKAEKSHNILGFLTNSSGLKKRSTWQPRGSTTIAISPLRQPNGGNETPNDVGDIKRGGLSKKYSTEIMTKKGIWPTRNKVIDSSGKENTEMKTNMDTYVDNCKDNASTISEDIIICNKELQNKCTLNPESEDVVSGFLYNKLQKEVINLRKLCEIKDSNLNCKDKEITILCKKIETLKKVIEVESKKMKREVIASMKEVILAKGEGNRKIRKPTPIKTR